MLLVVQLCSKIFLSRDEFKKKRQVSKKKGRKIGEIQKFVFSWIEGSSLLLCTKLQEIRLGKSAGKNGSLF